ncbi:beta-propeller domain-containing protein [Candidatus Pacearchaeota archaeon]|nr:beta-propeller domain-containing protein [Candidatus Pacearchaeota archaeon]
MKKLMTTSLAVGLLLAFFNTTNAQTFNDVHEMHLNQEAIQYLEENKVVEGYESGEYKPENRINRAEFIKIIVASQVENPTGSYCFPDVKNEWFAKYVCTAKKMGWVKGHPDGTFKPADYINFAEGSKIVTKALQVAPDTTGTQGEWFAGFVKGLENKKAIPTTIQFFDKDVSRGEMAEVIWRLEENVTDKVSQDYESITQEFPAIKSCAALQEKFKADQSFQYRYYDDVVMLEMDPSMDASTASPLLKTGGGDTAGDFSETNTQVRGVDEADIIKNDGKYIYLIKGDTVRIVEAFPASNMKEVASISFDDEGFNPRDMFINGDQLVVIGQSWTRYSEPIIKTMIAPHPYYRNGSRTKVFILDVSDRSNPKEERKLTFDGNYNTSRRINDKLYLVLNDRPDVWLMDEVRTGEDLLPQFQDGDKTVEKMVGCTDIHYFPGHARPNYLITAGIPLDDANGEVDREVFIGSSENVYSSRTHLYVATSQVSYDHYTDWDWSRDHTKTLVYRFALEDGNITYKARGSVPGRILNQFSMDAHINHFRIATTINQWNGDLSSNNVYVLNGDMETVGKIEDIAPGEKIYSTRFLGERLYMVTLRQVDPLFVIDLEDPENPKILGKLKIPGFSNYLHPFDKNHIIGFGKDTIETDKDRVLMQGFKMALFDVSDVANPKQKFAEFIGDRGTHSELLNNHKALLFDRDKELLAFPIRIQEKIDTESLECSKYRYSTCPNGCQKRCIPSCTEGPDGEAICTQDCEGLGSCLISTYDRYETTFSGAVVYSLNTTDGFSQRGRVTHYDDADLLKMGDYWPYNYENNIQRMLYMDDVLYSVSQGKVKANDIDSIEELNSLKID